MLLPKRLSSVRFWVAQANYLTARCKDAIARGDEEAACFWASAAARVRLRTVAKVQQCNIRPGMLAAFLDSVNWTACSADICRGWVREMVAEGDAQTAGFAARMCARMRLNLVDRIGTVQSCGL